MIYFNDINDICKNIEEYNLNKHYKVLIVFDGDMLNNKKLNPIVTETLVNIYLVFITKYYFLVPKNIRINSTHYFVMKIKKKRELQQIAYNHSLDIGFRHFMNLYKKCTKNPYFF